MSKLKTSDLYTEVTSGSSIEASQYKHATTYTPQVKVTCGSALQKGENIRYGGYESKIKVSTPASRKQDRIEKINQKLKQLGN